MSASNRRRLEKLEAAANPQGIKHYLCITEEGQPRNPKGYAIQSYAPNYGGDGGDLFYLETWEELGAFEARPDVDLLIINIVRASNEPKKQD